MLAAVFIKPGEPLQIETLPDPEPGPGEVVLRVHKCGICGTDLHLTEAHAFTVPAGFIAGHERGAEIVAIGKDVSRLKVGDHVVPHPMRGCGRCADCVAGSPYFCRQAQMAMGGFGQYMLTSEMVCARMPRSLSLADAAIVEPLAVGLAGIERNPIPPGANVLVIGVGPIGLASIFWAKRTGASRILAVATSRQREGLARKMGADSFITMSDTLVNEVMEEFGDLADIVIECAGAPGILEKSVALVKPRGSVTVLGLCTHADPWIPAVAVMKEIKLQFVVGTTLQQFTTVADFLSAGHVEPVDMVTDTISLGELPTMFEALRQRTTQCKVLVDPWR
jgi:(R,R)-butanediol dehydrogenase/meso-butanediol dehydrogenase/diacetyl reductase